MIREAIFKLVDKQDLTYDEAYDVINEIMSGETTQVQTAAFLSALSTKSTKSETIAEIAGCAAAMRSHATKVDYDKPLLEIVGTGGDKAGSFNISTTAAFIIAAGGAKVAKHGNRAASSKSGTADCQEAFGVNIEQGPDLCKKLLDEVACASSSPRNTTRLCAMWALFARNWVSAPCSTFWVRSPTPHRLKR